ncbi:hypothetical protein [Streptomyces sp. NPDC088719]|uniref:hypothetical protein n=1 Tax=Streptomyces sp. NPDC088719 TaxID=3365872 RepID=UPI0038094007
MDLSHLQQSHDTKKSPTGTDLNAIRLSVNSIVLQASWVRLHGRDGDPECRVCGFARRQPPADRAVSRIAIASSGLKAKPAASCTPASLEAATKAGQITALRTFFRELPGHRLQQARRSDPRPSRRRLAGRSSRPTEVHRPPHRRARRPAVRHPGPPRLHPLHQQHDHPDALPQSRRPRRRLCGNITSHRARSTIASLLYNAKEPMTLFELQAGSDTDHRNPPSTSSGTSARSRSWSTATRSPPGPRPPANHGSTTISVTGCAPTRSSNSASTGWPAPAAISARPRKSTRTQLVEAKANSQRLLVSIPLTDEERAAVDDGQSALDRPLERLAEVATPAAPTPNELRAEPGRLLPPAAHSAPDPTDRKHC